MPLNRKYSRLLTSNCHNPKHNIYIHMYVKFEDTDSNIKKFGQ